MPKINRFHILILSLLFWVIASLIFVKFGVKNVNDSHRYLEYATNLKNGFYVERHNIWYIGYVIFIYLVRLISGSSNELNIIIAKNILSYLALLLLYKTNLNFFRSQNIALICTLFYLIFIEIFFWNSYILCESLFISLTCISLYFLSIIHNRQVSLIAMFFAGILILLTILTKPTGIAVLIGVIGIITFNIWKNNSKPYLRYSMLIISTALILLLTNKMLVTFMVMENYEIGEVVYDITTRPYKPEYKLLLINVPEDLEILSSEYPPLIRIVHFMVFNLKYWIILFCAKVFFFLLHIRPYWSLEHNIFNLVILIPMYYYSFRYLISNSISKEIRVFSIFFFLTHILSIGITTVDWDGRFLMPLLPMIFILGSSEIWKDLTKIIFNESGVST